MQADGAQPLAEGAQCLVRLVQETHAVAAVHISSLPKFSPYSLVEYVNGYTQRRGCRPIPASGGQRQYNQHFCHAEDLLGERVKGMFTCGKGIKKKKLKASLEHLISFRLN